MQKLRSILQVIWNNDELFVLTTIVIAIILVVGLAALSVHQHETIKDLKQELATAQDSTLLVVQDMNTRLAALEIMAALQPIRPVVIIDVEDYQKLKAGSP